LGRDWLAGRGEANRDDGGDADGVGKEGRWQWPIRPWPNRPARKADHQSDLQRFPTSLHACHAPPSLPINTAKWSRGPTQFFE